MLKRNARVFSRNDMDMGRTNLVKHHIKLTDPVPFKESYRRIPPQMYDEVKAHIQEMLESWELLDPPIALGLLL